MCFLYYSKLPLLSLHGRAQNAPEESPFYIKMPAGSKYEETKITRVLEQGIRTHTEVLMSLAADTSRKLTYELKPLKIMNYDGFWYLLGINAYKEVRKFRLDRILDAINTDKPFKATKNIRKILQESQNIWFGEKRGYFGGNAREQLPRNYPHGTQLVGTHYAGRANGF